MNTLQYIRSGDGTLCIFVDGESMTVAPDLIAYVQILSGIEAGSLQTKQAIQALCDTQHAVSVVAETVSNGKVRVDLTANKVWYDGVEFPDKALCDRILRLMSEGQPFQFMVNFLERLGQNPNFRSVMALFQFISAKGFPITPDGKILAYKGINADWTDCYSGKWDNSVGKTNEMLRKDCDPDRKQVCSVGFHVGTHEYAVGWAKGHVVLVEIDPADVISVPDSNLTWKMRCCKYKVIADHTNLGILTGEVYDSTGKAVPVTTLGQFDNASNSHWDADEGRTYGNVPEREDADEDDDEDEDDWDTMMRTTKMMVPGMRMRMNRHY